jgi:dynein heavy chain, axonemal
MMDEKYVKFPNFDLESPFKDSTKVTPLIFILSPGADPRGKLL